MKDILNALERKRNQLESDYQSHLNSIRRTINDPIDVDSVTFEANVISHLVEMNSIKGRLREIKMQIDVISLM